jgi:hypothetical protein
MFDSVHFTKKFSTLEKVWGVWTATFLCGNLFLIFFWGEVGRWIHIAWDYFWTTVPFGGGGGGGF